MRTKASKLTRGARFRGCAFAVIVVSAASPSLANDSWSPSVTAVYKLRMAGIELATFNFNSTVKGESYTLAGQGKLSWGLGLYKYSGAFTGNGTLAGDEVRPAAYAYDWQVNKKSGSVKLGFARGSVTSVEIQPPHSPSPEVVPLKSEHLRSVFDPLTALIALSRYRGGDPCDRKISLFEGKQRFDLVLTPHREEKVLEPKPSGQPVVAHVCRVRYVPVAGHKTNRETQAAIKAEGIEVALRPIPQANLLVPYRITIPTPLGAAVLTAQRVDITGPGNRQIALTH